MDLKRAIELISQIVIAVAVLVVGGVALRRYVSPTSNPAALNSRERAQALKGTSAKVPNVNWKQNGKTLVFFLQKDCLFCKYAAPSYKQLLDEATSHHVKVMAVLPDSIEEGKQYLSSLSLPVETVQSAPLASCHIPATPTVVLVDQNGTIRSCWIGAHPNQEHEMHDELVSLFAEQQAE